METFNQLKLLVPEVCVIFGIVFAALWNLFFPTKKAVTPYVCMGFLGAAIMVLASQFNLEPARLFGPGYLFTVDKLTVSFSIIICAVGIITTAMTMGYERLFGNNRGEFYAVLMTAVLAVMILAGTTDLIMLFVALETLTICCVLLSGFSKTDKKSNEAALKYLLSTAATTATFLYGLSFLYGLTGTTSYYELKTNHIYVFSESPSLVFIFLIVLLISAIGFKLSMVPFHMWTPDVYEGAPTPVTAFLSVGSKLGGFVMAIRLLTFVFDKAATDWSWIISVLAIASMVVGNLVALAQTSLKRMLAYSSIAHVGYLLIGLAANSNEGLSAMVFYLMVYGFMNLGAFACAVIFTAETGSDNIDDLSGLIKKRPWLAICLAICLLNLAGLPVPPAGFLAKVFIFWAGFQMYNPMGYLLVVMALLTSIPAVFYYTKVVIAMIVKDPSERVNALPARSENAEYQTGPIFAIAICIAGIVASSLWVSPMMDFADKSISVLSKAPTVGNNPQQPAIGNLPKDSSTTH